jgi:hypothetical protein
VKLELLKCMYALAVISKELRRADDAMDRLEVADAHIRERYTQHMSAGELSRIPLVAISSLSLMVDFLMKRNETVRALDTLKIIWTAVYSRPSHFFDVHEIIARLTCKMLSLLLASEPYPTRMLISVVCEEVESKVEAAYGVDAFDAWSSARSQVLVGMFTEHPEVYFRTVVEGVVNGEVEANNAMGSSLSPKGAKSRRRSTLAASAQGFALQIAVIKRLAGTV